MRTEVKYQILMIHTQLSLQKLSLKMFSQKFRESNVFTKEVAYHVHCVLWKLRKFTFKLF